MRGAGSAFSTNLFREQKYFKCLGAAVAPRPISACRQSVWNEGLKAETFIENQDPNSTSKSMAGNSLVTPGALGFWAWLVWSCVGPLTMHPAISALGWETTASERRALAKPRKAGAPSLSCIRDARVVPTQRAH